MADPRPTSGHYRGDSVTHPMLITVFYIFDLSVPGSLKLQINDVILHEWGQTCQGMPKEAIKTLISQKLMEV